MPRKAHKYHYIYKTTCNVTGKYYIGMHSCSDLEDGYLGSGKKLRRSLNKYGIENHTKVILEFLPDRKSLAEREREIVNQEMLNEDLCMNIQLGGGGGFSSDEHKEKWIKAGRESITLLENTDPEFKKLRREKIVETIKREGKYEEWTSHIKSYRKDWTGLKHNQQTIDKMKNAKINHGKGSVNSQFGTCWITNETENLKINKGDLIPLGWRLGRKIK